MKTKSLPSLAVSRYHTESETLPVRVIKSAQAEAIFNALKKPVEPSHLVEVKADPCPALPKRAPEIHLLASGPDYCDLEVTCACGEVSKIRCWNALGESQPELQKASGQAA